MCQLTFQERLDLAVCQFGFYMFPFADPVDASVAMDNEGVPFLRAQLTDSQKEILAKVRGSHDTTRS